LGLLARRSKPNTSSKQTATLIYTKDLGSGGEVISQLGYLAFCDGLVLVRTDTKAQFRYRKFCKRTVDSPSHRIFGRMHEALNIDKK
jgi:hypothetical protein